MRLLPLPLSAHTQHFSGGFFDGRKLCGVCVGWDGLAWSGFRTSLQLQNSGRCWSDEWQSRFFFFVLIRLRCASVWIGECIIAGWCMSIHLSPPSMLSCVLVRFREEIKRVENYDDDIAFVIKISFSPLHFLSRFISVFFFPSSVMINTLNVVDSIACNLTKWRIVWPEFFVRLETMRRREPFAVECHWMLDSVAFDEMACNSCEE